MSHESLFFNLFYFLWKKKKYFAIEQCTQYASKSGAVNNIPSRMHPHRYFISDHWITCSWSTQFSKLSKYPLLQL